METTASAPLRRADGLVLLGTPEGSGYREARPLVRRRDGQTLQLTPLLYAVLEALDEHPDPAELAHVVGEATGKELSAEDVEFLVREKLSPLGVLADGRSTDHPTANPLLALRWKVVITDPRTTRLLTAPLAALFHPVVVWPVMTGFLAVCWFVLIERGLAGATRHAFDTPALLLGVFALTVLSAGLHEMGHAAACRYGGARPGAMGAGLYLVWPAFYTDVTDSYRLDRRGRLRVDLGGLYLNCVVAVAVLGLWWATGAEALLLGVATQLLQMLRQLAPVLRADGYHILSDLTGVPDLFAHLGPTLSGLLPWNWRRPSPLTGKARVIVTTWVLVVVPILVSMLVTAVLLLPRLIATAWVSGQRRAQELRAGVGDLDPLLVGASLLQLFALVLPVLGTLMLLALLLRRAGSTVLRWTDGRPFWRGVAGGAVLVLIAALVATWWPNGQYRPVRGDERGSLLDLAVMEQPLQVRPVSSETVLALVPRGGPTPDRPTVLLRRTADGLQALEVGPDGSTARAFPFALPDAPGLDTNQSLAVNDQDGSVVYDIAVSLLTIQDRASIPTNEAYGLASCTDCSTLSVAFQVVLLVGETAVAPVNTAVAANADCVRCTTFALARQLVLTLSALPDDAIRADLERALASARDVSGLSPEDILRTIGEVERTIVTTLVDAGLLDERDVQILTSRATPTPSAPASSASPSPTTTSPSATPTAATPQPSGSPSGSAVPTPRPSGSATATPTAAAPTPSG